MRVKSIDKKEVRGGEKERDEAIVHLRYVRSRWGYNTSKSENILLTEVSNLFNYFPSRFTNWRIVRFVCKKRGDLIKKPRPTSILRERGSANFSNRSRVLRMSDIYYFHKWLVNVGLLLLTSCAVSTSDFYYSQMYNSFVARNTSRVSILLLVSNSRRV